MNARLIRIAAAATLASGALVGTAADAAAPPSYVGTYAATDAAAEGVRHTIIRIAPNHTLTMRTTTTRHTERPVPLGIIRPVVETGTWTMSGGRLIFHVVSTTVSSEGGDQAPKFSDIAFKLDGCVLRIATTGASVGSLEFVKRDCSVL